VARSSREVLLLDLDLGRSRASTVLVDRLLCLVGVLLGKTLNSLGSVSGVLVGKTLDLSSLLAGDLATLLELGINDLLVLDVDEGSEVGDEGGDQGQAPKRNELDEKVRDQGSKEGLSQRISNYLVSIVEPAGSSGIMERQLTAPLAYTFSAKTMR
jgi:hypothetical protein